MNMSVPPYIKNLSPLERGAAIKLGACIAMARNNVTPTDLQKQAAMGRIDLVPKGILVTALLAGLPLGVLAHALGRATAPDNRQEREALDRLRYYQRMTAGMTTGLTQPKTEEEQNAGGAV